MTEAIPEDLRRFVLHYIDSIAEMETLVLLASKADANWSAEQVAAQLYIGPREAQRVLERLEAHGIAERADIGWRRAPLHEEDAAMIDRLVEVYARQLIPVTNLIHSKRSTSPAQQFAEAFRLRRRDGDRHG